MSSSQQAVTALINRSTVLLGELNRTRRTNRDLAQRLDQALARIAEFEGAPPSIAAGAPTIAGPSPLAAGAPLLAGPSFLAAGAPLLAGPLRPVAGGGDFAA